jgi:hypothetical protein
MEQWLRELFERQAARQRQDSKLPWPEKLLISIVIRESLKGLRAARAPGHSSPPLSEHGSDQ